MGQKKLNSRRDRPAPFKTEQVQYIFFPTHPRALPIVARHSQSPLHQAHRGTLLDFTFQLLKEELLFQARFSFALQTDSIFQTRCPRDILYRRLLGGHHNSSLMLERTSVLENVFV